MSSRTVGRWDAGVGSIGNLIVLSKLVDGVGVAVHFEAAIAGWHRATCGKALKNGRTSKLYIAADGRLLAVAALNRPTRIRGWY